MTDDLIKPGWPRCKLQNRPLYEIQGVVNSSYNNLLHSRVAFLGLPKEGYRYAALLGSVAQIW